MFLADELPERDFQDWIDAYWAKDIQELFRLERHWSHFVLPGRGERAPVAIECKWKADGFAPAALAAFRRIYPDGPNLVVATDVDAPYKRRFDAFEVEFVSLQQLIERLGGGTASTCLAQAPTRSSAL